MVAALAPAAVPAILPKARVVAPANDLTADLTVAERIRVNVGVRHGVPHRGDQFVDLAGRDAPSGRAYDVACRDRPRHLAGGRAGRLAAAAAEESRHAAVNTELAEVQAAS